MNPTSAYQNLLFGRVPINSILGFIVRTYKKVGFGRLRCVSEPRHGGHKHVLCMFPSSLTEADQEHPESKQKSHPDS